MWWMAMIQAYQQYMKDRQPDDPQIEKPEQQSVVPESKSQDFAVNDGTQATTAAAEEPETKFQAELADADKDPSAGKDSQAGTSLAPANYSQGATPSDDEKGENLNKLAMGASAVNQARQSAQNAAPPAPSVPNFGARAQVGGIRQPDASAQFAQPRQQQGQMSLADHLRRMRGGA